MLSHKAYWRTFIHLTSIGYYAITLAALHIEQVTC